MTAIPYGVASMTAPLRHVLVKEPGPAFAAAFDDPALGYRRPVDLAAARAEHARFVSLLTSLGVTVHDVGGVHPSADFIYQYDPSLVTGRGAILLRSGKPNRRGEEGIQRIWYDAHGIPVVGEIQAPGTVDGGDVFWLEPGVMCIGRSLRTNASGIAQLTELVADDVHVFDVPFDAGPAECLHLLSVISPVAADIAVVELRRLPAGLYELLVERDIRLVDVAAAEVESLACNVLAVRPGVVVMVEGNPMTRSRLEAEGVEVHTFVGSEICWNGSGGPTCLTRPIHRS